MLLLRVNPRRIVDRCDSGCAALHFDASRRIPRLALAAHASADPLCLFTRSYPPTAPSSPLPRPLPPRSNIESLLSFEGCDPYDGEIRSSQLPDLLKEMLSHELRLARLRLSRSNASTAASTDAGTAASPASKLAPVELPEHVKRLLAGVDGPVIAPSAAAGAGSAMAIDGNAAAGVPDADVVVVKRDFLQAAAERSRELQMERKRKAVMMDGPAGAAASAASSVPASSAAASGKRASGGPAAAVAGAGAAAAAATAAEKAAGAGAPVTGGQQQQKYPAVFYRYQEGFTNAVKRSLKIADFFK